MKISELEKLLSEPGKTRQEKQRMIKTERCRLLEEIHEKQQKLDRLDYMLHELKQTGGNYHE